ELLLLSCLNPVPTPLPLAGAGVDAKRRGWGQIQLEPQEAKEGMENTMRQTLLTLAREARHRPTLAENDLWERLRDHRCEGLHFRRQEIIGPFRLDFYCRRVKLVVEVDGSIHETESVQRRDIDRQQILEQEFGIYFLRVTNEDVQDHIDAVIAQISKTASLLLPSAATNSK
ncbi:MAG: endonuclease domain-containing protein, partial [Janthinobacterium lividum]